jgi:hypothetical protein
MNNEEWSVKKKMMKNFTTGIKKGLQKRQEAIDRFKASREAFMIAKKEIIKDIEEARAIWINTCGPFTMNNFK